MIWDNAMMMIFAFFSFWLGACVASFLNVVIWRVPRGESIVLPPSHCPKCNAVIKWWQNIPILSWLALRGKCANCGEAISPRYILIETLGALLFLATFMFFFGAADMPLQTTHIVFFALNVVMWWIWISLMIVGSFIDIDHQLLPDFVTVGGMVLGVVFHLLRGVVGVAFFPTGALDPSMTFWASVEEAVVSLVCCGLGFLLMAVIRWVGTKACKREAMGMGDVFLMGAVGAFTCSLPGIILTLIMASVIGSIVGVVMILTSKARLGKFVAIPFGPYLCLGCLISMFYGEQIVTWYLGLLHSGKI